MSHMSTNIMNWTKEEWITQAKQAEPEFTHCFIPVLSFSFLHNLPSQADVYRSFKHYVTHQSTRELEAVLESTGLSVLATDESILPILSTVGESRNDAPSLEQQFLDKQRNIFIVHVSDSYYHHKTVTLVCEYTDPSDPLADYTVDYEAVADRDAMRKSAASFIARMRQSSSSEEDFPF